MLLVNNAIAAIVNVAVGLVLIPRFGLVGTAISALGTLTLFQIAVLIEVAVTQNVHPFHLSVAKPFLAGVVALLAARFAQNHLQSTMGRVPMVIGAGLGVYLIGLLALGLPAEDRRLLLALINRVRGTRGR
jgi:O-antigen/teichoic acid export membrane protein